MEILCDNTVISVINHHVLSPVRRNVCYFTNSDVVAAVQLLNDAQHSNIGFMRDFNQSIDELRSSEQTDSHLLQRVCLHL